MKTATELSKATNDNEKEYEMIPIRVQSPCNKMCRLDSEDVCYSCGRTLEQIRNWRHLSQEEKLKIVNNLKANFKPDERRQRR